jgi:alkylation response protein AidB-like acyl-CoA dehydrogenase
MSDLDLLYRDVEDELRASVRSLLTDRCPPSAVLPVYEGDRSLVAPLWKALATDLGLAGLLVPEKRGGSGASAREAAVVLEELGRAVVPVPFLTSSVVAATVLPGQSPVDPRTPCWPAWPRVTSRLRWSFRCRRLPVPRPRP